MSIGNRSRFGQVRFGIFQLVLFQKPVIPLIDLKHVQHLFLQSAVQFRTGIVQLFRRDSAAAKLGKHHCQFADKRSLPALFSQQLQFFLPFRNLQHRLIQQCHFCQFVRIGLAVRHAAEPLEYRTCQRFEAVGFQLVKCNRSEDPVEFLVKFVGKLLRHQSQNLFACFQLLLQMLNQTCGLSAAGTTNKNMQQIPCTSCN